MMMTTPNAMSLVSCLAGATHRSQIEVLPLQVEVFMPFNTPSPSHTR
jgi:hypothetical protein